MQKRAQKTSIVNLCFPTFEGSQILILAQNKYYETIYDFTKLVVRKYPEKQIYFFHDITTHNSSQSPQDETDNNEDNIVLSQSYRTDIKLIGFKFIQIKFKYSKISEYDMKLAFINGQYRNLINSLNNDDESMLDLKTRYHLNLLKFYSK
jgi:hypothetical protein